MEELSLVALGAGWAPPGWALQASPSVPSGEGGVQRAWTPHSRAVAAAGFHSLLNGFGGLAFV